MPRGRLSIGGVRAFQFAHPAAAAHKHAHRHHQRDYTCGGLGAGPYDKCGDSCEDDQSDQPPSPEPALGKRLDPIERLATWQNKFSE